MSARLNRVWKHFLNRGCLFQGLQSPPSTPTMKVLCCPGVAVGMGAVGCAIPKQIQTVLTLGVCTNCFHPIPINHSRRCSLQKNPFLDQSFSFGLADGFGTVVRCHSMEHRAHLGSRKRKTVKKEANFSSKAFRGGTEQSPSLFAFVS